MNKKKDFISVSGKKYDGMMGRCYRTSDRSYKNYGERGIRVCSEWIKDIESFRFWLLREINRLNIDISFFIENSKKLQLERKNVNGHYSPDNCTLISGQANTRNRNCIKRRTLISAEGEKITIGVDQNE
jgi:hypothetical protein